MNIALAHPGAPTVIEHPFWGQVLHDPQSLLNDGSFVIGSGPEVYWINAGQRRHVPDPTTLLAIAPNGWQSVVHVSDGDLNAVPLGAPVPSREDGRVYKGGNAAEVYVIQALARHHIPDPETLEAKFGGWAAVVVIDQADCDAIPAGDPIPSVNVPIDTVDGYLRSLPDLAVDPVAETHTPIGTSPVDVGGITYDVTKEHATIRRQQSQPLSLSPALDVLYPGALLQARSLSNGQLAPVAGGLPRAGGTLTVATDVNSGGAPRTASQVVTSATQAQVQDARHNLVYSLNPDGGAAVVDFSQAQARSAEHGLVKLGVSINYSAFSGDLSTSLDTDVKLNTVMVMLTQVFYTVTFTPPDGPNAFFADTVTLDAVKQVCTTDNPACYISQIDYGRTLVMTITGTESTTKMAAALTAGLKTSAVQGKVTVSADDQKTLTSSTIQVIARGGQDKLALQLVADPLAQLPNYLTAGGAFTAANPGVPLRYIVRHAGSRHIVTINMAAAYNESVAVHGRDVLQTFQVWDGPGGGPFSTGIQVGNQDQLSIHASGQNASGVIFTGPYGPEGWTTWDKPSGNGYPLPDHHPFGLCGTWDNASIDPNHPWFWIGVGFDGKPVMPSNKGNATLYLGTNDNNPLNGDAHKKFTVQVRVNRDTSGFTNVGRAAN